MNSLDVKMTASIFEMGSLDSNMEDSGLKVNTLEALGCTEPIKINRGARGGMATGGKLKQCKRKFRSEYSGSCGMD